MSMAGKEEPHNPEEVGGEQKPRREAERHPEPTGGGADAEPDYSTKGALTP